MRLEFQVPSRSEEGVVYLVDVSEEYGEIRMRCDCPAGQRGGMPCSHRLKLIAGDVTDVSATDSAFQALPDMLRRAAWFPEIAGLEALEAEKEAVEMRLRTAKRRIAYAMNGFGPDPDIPPAPPKPKTTRRKRQRETYFLELPGGAAVEITRAEAEAIAKAQEKDNPS